MRLAVFGRVSNPTVAFQRRTTTRMQRGWHVPASRWWWWSRLRLLLS